MKKLILLLAFMSVAAAATAQIEATRPADFRYYITVDGDTVANRSLDYKAFQDAVNYKCDYPGSQIVVHPIGVTITGSCPEAIIDDIIYIDAEPDTVYADTLVVREYATYEPAHHALFKEVDFSMGHDSSGENRSIRFIIETQESSVDTLHTEIRCGSEWVENNTFVRPGGKLQYGILWDCSSPLTYQFEAVNTDGWSETITNSYPLWMTEYELPSADRWVLFWGDLTYEDLDSLVITIPTRNIARIKDQTVPAHRNIEVAVTETVDSSHSTGIHLGLRSSQQPQQHAVETYLNSEGLGVSIFKDGNWSNPHNFPVKWEYGVPIEYRVRLIDDTLIVTTGGETYEYTSEVIGSIQSGYFAIGSTGPGTYIINQIETNVLD